MERFLKKIIGKQYEVETHLFDLIFSSVFLGIDRSSGKNVCIVVGMSPLINDPGVHEEFLERMNFLATVNHQICPIIKFGIDSKGYPFSIIPGIDGIKIVDRVFDNAEAERRFNLMLRSLAQFHKAGFAFGDLSENSFWLERTGNLRIVAGMGDIREHSVNKEICNKDLFEIFVGNKENLFKRDVKSLGLLLVRFFTGKYPRNLEFPLEDLKTTPPGWFLTLAPKMLKMEFNSIVDVASQYVNLKNAPTALQERKSSSNRALEEKQALMVVGPQLKSIGKKSSSEISFKRVKIMIGILALAFLMLVGSLMIIYLASTSTLPSSPENNSPSVANSSEETLRGLVNSDDPLSFQTLLNLLHEAKGFEEFKRIHYAILQRAIRQGLSVSAELVRRWSLNFFDKGQLMPTLDVYKLFDVSLPVQTRIEILQNISNFDARAAKLLAVGFVFDLKSEELFQALIKDFFKLDKLDLPSLILSDTDLLMEYRDFITDFSSLETQQLYGILENLLSWGFEDQVPKILNHLNQRDVSFRERIALSLFEIPSPINVKLFLAKLLQGTVAFDLVSNWRDTNLSKLALSAVPFATSKEDLEKLWAIINQSPVSEKNVSEALKIIRSRFSDQKLELLNLLTLMAFSKFYPTADAISILKDHSFALKKDKELLKIVFDLENEGLITAAFKIFKHQLTIGQLLHFLNHNSPEIRKSAIESLIGVKDLGAMKIILDNYNKEKNSDVRKLYEDSFWFIRERSKISGASG
ncbi:MAG: hypothetical protein NZT61_04385 [Deltaproteobacteria bacterium]|nr:hypothetical protein [Deltaproteobacteria bacterium]